VAISSAPLDVNINGTAAIGTEESRVTVVTLPASDIELTGFVFEAPAGAEDGIISTDQECTVAASVIASENADSVRLELVLPTGFTVTGDAEKLIGRGDGTEKTARWNITAPSAAVADDALILRSSGRDMNSGDSFTGPEGLLDVQVVEKSLLDLSYHISEPPEATDRILSVGLSFTVEAIVENLGSAGVDTAGARLEMVLPDGYTLDEDTYNKPFFPGEAVTWNLRAPGSPAPSPADITVRFVEPYARDENTDESAPVTTPPQAPISVVTVEGWLLMDNLSVVPGLDSIPPNVVPQGAVDVPVLRVRLRNNSAYTLGLDTLYLTIEGGGRGPLSDPSRYVSSIELVTAGGVDSASVTAANPVPIVVDHGYTIGEGEMDTVYLRVDIAGDAPAGELRFDIAGSDDVFFTISDGPRVGVVWEGDEGDIEGHFTSGPLVVMSRNFEEYMHNYPNPFRAGSESTRIAYYMTEDASVSIRIYDLMGNLVWSKDIEAGESGATGSPSGTWCEVTWNGRNDRGQLVRNGVYLCKVQAGSQSATCKIAVAK
jgi:hypothetical protein